MNFKNQYGELTLIPVSDVRSVKDIRGADINAEHKFDIETAEKIALITDNRGIQIAAEKDWSCYVLVHDSPSTACVARIGVLNYIGRTPAAEIVAAARRSLI